MFIGWKTHHFKLLPISSQSNTIPIKIPTGFRVCVHACAHVPKCVDGKCMWKFRQSRVANKILKKTEK